MVASFQDVLQALLLVHFLRRAKSFSERSVKAIILTDMRAMPLPAPVHCKHEAIYTLPYEAGKSFIDLEFGFKVPEYSPVSSDLAFSLHINSVWVISF